MTSSYGEIVERADDDVLAASVPEHDWFVPGFVRFECCRVCGMVRRKDGKPNKPCRGRVYVSLRSDAL